MKKKIVGCIALGTFLLSAQTVFADGENLFRIRASVGYTSYAISLSGSGISTPSATSQYSAVGGGVTYATGNIYVDVTGSISLSATHDWPGGFEGDFKRTDSGLTVGYLLDQGWSAFGGYKYGKSDFFQANNPGYRLTFEAYGPFVGGSKLISLDKGASMSFNSAVAVMTGDVNDTGTINDSGSSIGLSFSATYNLPISDNSGFQLRGFYQKYSFDNFRTVVDADESILGVEVGFHLNF